MTGQGLGRLEVGPWEVAALHLLNWVRSIVTYLLLILKLMIHWFQLFTVLGFH